MKEIVLLFAVLLLSFRGFSQTTRELGSLFTRIGMFIDRIDNKFTEGRQTEFAQVLLEIDSAGKVGQVHVMGIDTDTIYKMLRRMQPGDFNNWTCLEAKGKTMVIPFFYVANNLEHNYAFKLYRDYSKIPLVQVVSKSDDILIVNYMALVTPLRPTTD